MTVEQPLSILDVAKALRITHPAVNQIACEMIERGVVYEIDDPTDKRKRLIGLTEKGKSLIPQLEKVWQQMHNYIVAALQEADPNFLNSVAALEESLNNESWYQRFTQEWEG
jgi:DNA-binding MarR family transcriptional regulator